METCPAKTIRLAAPRGFCAGVDRAVRIVEVALERYGAPVYVRHEIVHNRHVVESLAARGAVFVDTIAEIPDSAPVVFSAHGVSRAVVEEAAARNMIAIDATCPLVTKVHLEARRHEGEGCHILLIGHAGHPEVEGTMGQVAPGKITLIETPADAEAFTPPADTTALAYATQTTLSVDDTAAIVKILKRRFPAITPPHGEDICYATTNRQNAVKAIAADADLVLVIGAENSSNSRRLVEVALAAGAGDAQLISDASAIDFAATDKAAVIGITAGASAPEILVEQLMEKLAERYTITTEEITTAREDVTFNLPPGLRPDAAAARA